MNEYFYDISYLNAREFKPEQVEKICRDAYSKCYNWWVDNQPGWTREKINMSFDDVIKFLYTNEFLFNIIHRRGYEEWNTENSFNKWHLEIGFCTMGRKDPDGDIFLWIELEEKYIPHFITTYKLRK